MTRRFRLLAITVGALALAATAIAQLSLPVGPPASTASARQPLHPSAPVPTSAGDAAAKVTAAGPAGGTGSDASDALARTTPLSRGTGAAGSDYPLSSAPLCSWAVLNLKDKYVDPARFQPKEMLVAALEAVEKRVAEVMVEGDANNPHLTLTVGSSKKDLDITRVQVLWDVREKLAEAFGFIQAHLVSKMDLREIEYAAVNGMVSTLDPHTQFLDPRSAKELRIQTKGEFGGVGFAITMRDGNLTVLKVLKNTPAQRAGIKPKEIITRIEDLSTDNMDLQDAVDHLRGAPKSKVNITVLHAGAKPRVVQITREMIRVDSVAQAELLPGDVGYVKLSQFSGNTAAELKEAVDDQRRRAGVRLTGLILDLRGNPGGLLEQAVEVSDLFLSSGVIVKTVGMGDVAHMNEVRQATASDDDILNLPLVVLVNQGSASASEIVAGALKNNDRALIVGRTTFGKGSVQTLNEYTEHQRSNEEPGSFKITIAQYLTPGDYSIQETGITPDVMLLPGRALKDQVNYFAPLRTMGEVDLDRHLANPGDAAKSADGPKRRVEKASLELRYLLDEKEDAVAKALRKEAKESDAEQALSPAQQEDEDSGADPDQFVEDYQIRFAADLVRQAPKAVSRPLLLEAARQLVEERTAEETARLEARLKELGVDWRTGPVATAAGKPKAVVTFTPPPVKDVRAGETLPWTVTVENKGKAPFHRLRGWTSSDKNALLDRREFLFGTVKAGEKRSWTVPVKLPRFLYSGRDEVLFHFDDDGGEAPADMSASIGVVEPPKPVFAFSVQADDRQGGNGDGLVRRGERFTLHVDVKNEGAGAAGEKTVVILRNLGDEHLVVIKGRQVIGPLKPGEVRTASLELELPASSAGERLPVRVTVMDDKTFEQTSQELDLEAPRGGATPVAAATGALQVTAKGTVLRAGAAANAPALAVANPGAVLPVLGKVGRYYQVEWKKGRMAFAAAGDVAPSKRTQANFEKVAEAWQNEPPRIELEPDPEKGAPVSERDTWHLSGSAYLPPSAGSEGKLRDVFVLVNDQKVFFQVQPEHATTTRLDFATDVPLKPGTNVIAVIARESEELQSQRLIKVLYRPPAAVASDGHKQTPETVQVQRQKP